METEIKVEWSDLDELRRRILDLGAVLLSACHFEDNRVLDLPDGALRARRCLLRVRVANRITTLTFKGPPLPAGLFKQREELETSIGDDASLLRILAELGMDVWFRYQKYREEFVLSGMAPSGSELHLALDETPIGNFIEIEGAETGIREVTRRLGIDLAAFIRESYYDLYVQRCQSQGRVPGHMVFEGWPGDTKHSRD